MGNSISSSLPVPRGYTVQKLLAEGDFGSVYQCVKPGTDHTLVVKTGKASKQRNEGFMLNDLMSHNLDECNIVKFYGMLISQCPVSLMLEVLDISLEDYLLEVKHKMPQEDIRTIIQQLATALNALKRIGVIHSNLKPDNIMMVDHVRQPLKVKLINFSSAIFRSKAKPCKTLQTLHYRAPEIILGLPFSEAIDIWSLGCVMSTMVFGFRLPGDITEYDRTHLKKNSSSWHCIDLLMAMLKWPEKDRITPSGILHHPFITKSYLNKNVKKKKKKKKHFVSQMKSSETLPPGVIMVRPADPMNRTNCVETSGLDSETSPHPATVPATAVDTTRIHKDKTQILVPYEQGFKL